MTHGSVRRRLSAFLDGDLTPSAAERIEHHLAECPECRAELAALRRVVGWLHDLPAEEPPPTLAPQIFARIAAEQPVRPGLGSALRRWLETGWTAPLAAAAVGLLVLAWLQGYPAELRPFGQESVGEPPAAQAPIPATPGASVPGMVASDPAPVGGVTTLPVAETSGMPANLGTMVVGSADASAGQDSSLGLPPLSSCVDLAQPADPACARWQAWMLGLALRDPLAFAAQLEAVPSGFRETWIGQLSRIAADSGSAPLLAEQLRATHDPRVAGMAVRLERTVAPVAPSADLPPQH